MDLIDRQAAIDAVSRGCQEFRGIFADCEENLNELPSVQPEPKWIPCSERLPNTNGIYIVTRTISDGFEYCNIVDACYFDGSDTWYDDTRINHERKYLTDVVAWMPLPEPYREEGEQGRSDQDREDMVRRIISICDDARLGYNVSTYNNCNNCGRKECQFKPEWGETIWWKCPLWKEGEK